MKCYRGQLTFHCIIDYWGTRSDTNLFYGMPGNILSFNFNVIGCRVRIRYPLVYLQA